ncbi:MAG: hypothetical protein M3T55_00695 [Pseudomonadota bacterium]|nr:hypothetical protein [Pseudomonadota bacterium]
MLTIASAPRSRSAVLVEALLALTVVVALGFVVWRFREIGYAPQPFLYDLNYPLMGLYDTAYWANHSGAYDLGKAIYPPLSFVFLRLFTAHGCYAISAFAGRDCDGFARWVIVGFYLLNAVLVWRCFRKLDAPSALPRALAVSLGLPMLYGLECANLIIVAFTFFVLGYSGLIRSAPLRWLALGLSINFKPYLLVLLFPPLIRRQWRWLVGCATVAGLIYVSTYGVEGAGSPLQLISNLRLYAADITHEYWSDVYYGTSYWPLIRFMSSQFQLLGLASPHSGDVWRLVFIVLIRGAQLGGAVCVVAAWFRPQAVNAHRFAAMILALILTTITTGQSGYVQIFLFFLIFFEPWRGPVRILILVCTYLLSVPADFVVAPVVHGGAWSYLGGRPVVADFGVSVGQLLRPAVLLIIQFGLIALNLRDVVGPRPAPLVDTPALPA